MTETLEISGRDVRVDVVGDREATPVLLLHGIGRSLEDWDELADRLIADHRVIRMDLPGFGYSTRAAGEVGLASVAQAIPRVLDAVGETRPVHVAGNSLGGWVALEAFLPS